MALLYRMHAFCCKSLTLISPFPQGTTIRVLPKHMVTFMFRKAKFLHATTDFSRQINGRTRVKIMYQKLKVYIYECTLSFKTKDKSKIFYTTNASNS